MTTASKPLNVAIAGLGQLGGDIAKYIERFESLRLVAAADPREGARTAFRSEYEGQAFASIEELARDPATDAVFIATPSSLHCEHVMALANAGKHIVLTKPMAITLDECDSMIQAVERNGVTLVYGSGGMPFRPSFLGMRQVIETGRVGRLRAITHMSFGDWMLRPRMPHEVSTDGGLLLNQGPHAVDAIRLIGGGMVRSVRGTAIDMDLPGRPCAGYLSAFIDFEDGTAATITYNGYGYLYGWELTPWANEPERLRAMQSSYAFRRDLQGGGTDEARVKEQSRFGGREKDEKDFRQERGQGVKQAQGWVPHDEGIVIAHCEHGAVRQSPNGLYIYDEEGRWDEAFPEASGTSAEGNEIEELLIGIAGKPVSRDARWGKATLEVVLAIAESGRTGADIPMRYQVPLDRTAR